MSRTYHFDLPYEVSGFMLSMGWGTITDDPHFAQIPRHVMNKILVAHDQGASVTLTREDLDSIPDDTWAYIASKLGLQYS